MPGRNRAAENFFRWTADRAGRQRLDPRRESLRVDKLPLRRADGPSEREDWAPFVQLRRADPGIPWVGAAHLLWHRAVRPASRCPTGLVIAGDA